jgi:hypothetical protein
MNSSHSSLDATSSGLATNLLFCFTTTPLMRGIDVWQTVAGTAQFGEDLE